VAFLRSIRPDEDFEVVHGRALTLRQPVVGDYMEWAELRALSRAHLTPWEPTWSQDDLSRAMYRRRLRAYAKDVHNDVSYPYFIFDNTSGTLLGGITLSNVRRGSAQTASLGYWMGAPYTGRGHMREAVGMLLPMVFNALRLHRIEAATMLKNFASMRVLESVGFEREGLAHSYLKINGRWEDHLLYARLADGSVRGTSEQGG
jgi:[ribosomal protein S5]-alanine N-acetyltransferase